MGNKLIEKGIPTTRVTPPPPKSNERSVPRTNATPPPSKGSGKK